ncbi:MAG: hypothetical protein V5A64_05480 [Candidatus Thermoplasmatota archaeon]
MRREKITKKKTHHFGLYLTILLLFLSIITISFFPSIKADTSTPLQIELSNWTPQAGEKFRVDVYIIKDGSEEGVSNATVYLDEPGIEGTTNNKGHTWLTAPSEPGDYAIYVNHKNYDKYQDQIVVSAAPPFWEDPNFVLFVAGLSLVFAVVFVYLRQKTSIYQRAKEISKEKILSRHKKNTGNKKEPEEKKENIGQKKYGTYDKLVTSSSSDSKVEEIRIRRPRKEKEVVSVDEKEEDETEKVVSEKIMKKRDRDWFEGTDDIRYEIDKITGEIDEEGVDKWFEGTNDLRKKIDEKLKEDKKKKKNKEDEEEEE